jgi:hypothetical protein
LIVLIINAHPSGGLIPGKEDQKRMSAL